MSLPDMLARHNQSNVFNAVFNMLSFINTKNYLLSMFIKKNFILN
jgi:hypothetical protein